MVQYGLSGLMAPISSPEHGMLYSLAQCTTLSYCSFTIYVQLDNYIHSRPRALAVAERLWSSKETTDLSDAAMRIWEHRCRFLRYDTNN